METPEKLLTAISGIGLLFEFKNHLLTTNQQQQSSLSMWPGIKLTFYSSMLLLMAYKWYTSGNVKQNRRINSSPKSDVKIRILYGTVTGKAKVKVLFHFKTYIKHRIDY
jgi:hypothetical protein